MCVIENNVIDRGGQSTLALFKKNIIIVSVGCLLVITHSLRPPCCAHSTARGSSGPLLAALITYILSPSAQANLPSLGFAPLSSTVVQYCMQRALPLLSVDTRYAPWFFEPSSGTK